MYTDIPKPTASSYTNVGKPVTPTNYTNLTKPTLGYTILKGMATGLLTPPTYSVTRNFGNSYTNISKPT